jgi:hypothetical protein
MVRMQLKNIVGADNKNIGSVLYAQSFFWIESKTNVCVTKNIPNTQFFNTSEKHYMYTPIPIEVDNKEAPLKCELLGERSKDGKPTYNNIIGLLPLTTDLQDMMEDSLLSG